MAEATKGRPTAVLVQQNYSQSLHVYFAPHIQTHIQKILKFKSEIQKSLSLTNLYLHVFLQ